MQLTSNCPIGTSRQLSMILKRTTGQYTQVAENNLVWPVLQNALQSQFAQVAWQALLQIAAGEYDKSFKYYHETRPLQSAARSICSAVYDFQRTGLGSVQMLWWNLSKLRMNTTAVGQCCIAPRCQWLLGAGR